MLDGQGFGGLDGGGLSGRPRGVCDGEDSPRALA
jgi:hypothetical protein